MFWAYLSKLSAAPIGYTKKHASELFTGAYVVSIDGQPVFSLDDIQHLFAGILQLK